MTATMITKWEVVRSELRVVPSSGALARSSAALVAAFGAGGINRVPVTATAEAPELALSGKPLCIARFGAL